MSEAAARRVTVRVPGSSANLGPGFDTFGLALQIYTTISLELPARDEPDIPLVRLNGEIARQLPADRSNLVFKLLSSLWKERADLLERVRITIESDIPLGRGLGSSASATLGTIWAAAALAGQVPDRRTALAQASHFEGHPDNAAASLCGGLVVCGRSQDAGIIAEKLQWPEDWCTLSVVPPYPLSTEESRAALLQRVELVDAVTNIQNAALIVAAVARRDEDVMREALHDRLHERHRIRLVPELEEIRRRLSDLPIIGCVLSGAGSSVLVLTNRRHKERIRAFLQEWAARRADRTAVLDLPVDQAGIRQIAG